MEDDLTCREFVEFLDAYRTDALPADVRARFATHLSECPDCERYLAAYETTIALTKVSFAAADAAPPDDVPEALVQAILRARGPRRA